MIHPRTFKGFDRTINILFRPMYALGNCQNNIVLLQFTMLRCGLCALSNNSMGV